MPESLMWRAPAMCSGSTEPPLRQTFSFSSTRDDQFIQAASQFCASQTSAVDTWHPPYFPCCSMSANVCKESRWNWRREKQTMGHIQRYLARNYFRHVQSYISPYIYSDWDSWARLSTLEFFFYSAHPRIPQSCHLHKTYQIASVTGYIWSRKQNKFGNWQPN